MSSESSSNNNYNPAQNEKRLKYSIYLNKWMNEYIYQLDANIPNQDPPEFICIVDKSGSMGSTFNEIITRTIPEVLNSLGYGNRKIHLITFDDKTEHSIISQSELKNSNLISGGRTYMAKSYDYLEEIFNNSKEKCNNLRILIITDGKLHDQDDTKQKGELLYEKYKNIFQINSQCIRLYTNSKSPETEGMLSFLKFNNVKCCDLVNHERNQLRSLSKVITELFINDGLIGNNLKIKGDKDINLKNFPWEEISSNIQPFKNGKYIFFGDKNEPSLFIEKEKTLITLECAKREEINT